VVEVRGETSIYRRVGLHVWDPERLEALEFMCPLRWQGHPGLRPEKALSREDHWFTWESIRSEEDLTAADSKRINEFPAEFINIDFGFYVEGESYRWPFRTAAGMRYGTDNSRKE
jgi:hypothetical protein